MNDLVTEVDTLVIGAGPAGAVHAVRRVQQGGQVLVVAPRRRVRRGTFELLSGASAPLLRELGLLDAVRRRAPECDGTVHRWSTDQFGHRSGEGWTGGWIIDRAWFDPLLREWVASCGARVRDAVATSVEDGQDAASVTIRAADGRVECLRAGRVAFATGRAGRLPARSGLSPGASRQMVAITTARPGPFPRLGARLLVDAAPTGWWYAMGDGVNATVGYVTDADLLAVGPGRAAATWHEATAGVGWLPAWARDAEVRGRPSAVRTGAVRSGRLMALGDAATAPDPLSGHGLHLAFAGAVRSVDAPEDYEHWAAVQRLEHDRAGSALYAAARHDGPFWRRRTRVPSEGDR